jgi:glycerophosphoryl diester phosphodiesterase
VIPKLVAHRGYMQDYPENSLSGIEQALRAGACMVEFDVQLSADHQLFVLHDTDFERTAGRPDSVFDLKQADIKKISVHEPQRFGSKFKPTPVPTLKQMMDLIKKYPEATAFVEIKDESLDRWGFEFVMYKLHEVLKPYASQCAVIAYNIKAVQDVKQRGLCRTGWVLTSFNEEHQLLAQQLKPDYLICNHEKLPDDFKLSNSPWQECGAWMLYDITDPEQALQWAKRGITLIETRDVGAMLKHSQLKKSACQHDV